ncbi:Beta-glucosidase 11 [Sesamum angolense]|uniref:Beta-glucosidase 11 n=1 Tax=Sesamum angolense TaxID=2727404 RepID=A0AAE1WJK1_9LAMI|nr:Beta-glucosidase 11 [Sesamum angolense]
MALLNLHQRNTFETAVIYRAVISPKVLSLEPVHLLIRWKELQPKVDDIKLMKQMGFDGYRFSISWPRVLPGMNDFVEFAELCFQEFGDRVKFWTTFNEPWSYIVHGYTVGDDFRKDDPTSIDSTVGQRSSQTGRMNLPANRLSKRVRRFDTTTQTTSDTWFPVNDPAKDAYTAARNLLLCHSAAAKSYREKFRTYQNGTIGIVLNSSCHYAYDSTSQADQQAVQRAFDFMLGWFLEPVIYGQFPSSMLDAAGDNIVPFSDDEKEGLAGSVDWVGLNYYTADFVAYEKDPPGVGYPADQHCIYSWVADNNDYTLTAKQACVDPTRIQYFQEHLAALLQAIQDLNFDVRGFFAWSYCDNFEWTTGYTSRFGIIYTDYVNDLTRYMKNSAFWFTKFLRPSLPTLPALDKGQVEKDPQPDLSESKGSDSQFRIYRPKSHTGKEASKPYFTVAGLPDRATKANTTKVGHTGYKVILGPLKKTLDPQRIK